MTSPDFDFRDADLVLRANSPSPLEFRVHKCILSAASTFFESMFSLPQAPAQCESTPVIDVPERASTLELLLRYIYPMRKPKLDDLDVLVLVLEAACKYDVAVAIDALRTLLLAPHFIDSDPLRVFAIACRFELEEEARLASRHTLTIKVVECPLSDDLRYISAYQYHRLLDLHRKRAQAAQELIVYSDEFKCMMCNGTHYGAFLPPKWWKDWQQRARTELAQRPGTDVIFSVTFLAESAKAGCERCAGSILDAHWFLEKLKRDIDALPSTI